MAKNTKNLFEQYTQKQENTGCLLWTTALDIDRYPLIPGTADRADLVVFEKYHGRVPKGHYVLRRCGNNACIEPLHLFANKLPIKDLVREFMTTHLGCTKDEIASGLGLSLDYAKLNVKKLRAEWWKKTVIE